MRLTRLRESFASGRIDCLLVGSMPNIFYLTGFTGSAGVLLVEESRATLYTDGRYELQAKQEVRGAGTEVGVVIVRAGALKRAARRARRYAHVGFEKSASFAAYGVIVDILGGKRARASDALVENLRAVKEAEEIAAIRRSVELNSRVFDEIVPLVRVGVAEQDLAAELEYRMRRNGAERMAFDTIVAAGPRSALPHARAGVRAIGKNEFVVFDHGAILANYASDMTRTVFVGAASRKARSLYGTVKEAQQSAIDAVRAGISCAAVDRAARGHIAAAGYDRFFTHSTGHGLGIEVHETPRVARREKKKLPAGAVITIEPGVYIPEFGGVRIEDVVVVREGGAEVLTPTPKGLLEL